MSSLRSRLEALRVNSLGDLVLWKSPISTGAFVSCIVFLVVMLGFLNYSSITLACRLIQVLMLVLGALVWTKMISLTPDDVRNTVRSGVEALTPITQNFVDWAFYVTMWENPYLSVSCLLSATLLAMLGSVVSDKYIVVGVTVLVFGGAPLYHKYKSKVDPYLERVKRRVDKLVEALSLKKTKAD